MEVERAQVQPLMLSWDSGGEADGQVRPPSATSRAGPPFATSPSAPGSRSRCVVGPAGAPHVSEPQPPQAVPGRDGELGYRPNRLARGLSSPRTGTVGVLLNDLRNPWFVDLLEGLTASLHAAGAGTGPRRQSHRPPGGPEFRGDPAGAADRRHRRRRHHHGNRCPRGGAPGLSPSSSPAPASPSWTRPTSWSTTTTPARGRRPST